MHCTMKICAKVSESWCGTLCCGIVNLANTLWHCNLETFGIENLRPRIYSLQAYFPQSGGYACIESSVYGQKHGLPVHSSLDC